jgi:ESS family glutamate:Na+ symporter
MLRNGEIDMLSDVSYTKERAEDILYSRIPMTSETYYIFIKAGNDKMSLEDINTFNGKVFAADKDSMQAEYIKKWAENVGIKIDLLELMDASVDESFEMLKKGGAGVVKFLMIAIVAILIQDLIGGVCAPLFGLDAKLGLAMGSVALVGGHGTSASFGPYLEELNAAGATTVAIASATYGLVAGCVIGGPIATARIRQYKLSSRGSSEKATVQVSVDTDTGALDADDIKFASILIVVSVGLGTLVSLAIGLVINMPAYIGAMLTAAVIRNVADARGKTLPMPEITTLGNVCLSLFLSQAMISMKLWELVSLAVPMIAILLLQTVVMALYAYFVVFMAMGRDYDAATMSAGFCGFGMGATPNAIANMQAITKKYGPSPVSFMIVPLVGALFIDFFNASLITLFANFF